MQDRKPFDLKNVMIVYNISQIVGNLALLFFVSSVCEKLSKCKFLSSGSFAYAGTRPQLELLTRTLG